MTLLNRVSSENSFNIQVDAKEELDEDLLEVARLS